MPERLRFVSFPEKSGPWKVQGRPHCSSTQIEQVLKPEDYIVSNYSKAKNEAINFYVAYYASQRKGYSPHSPIVCIPGWGLANNEIRTDQLSQQISRGNVTSQ